MKRRTGLTKRCFDSFLLFFLCLFLQGAQAQEVQWVQVTGKSISRDKSPDEAFDEALNDARKQALLRAGVPEQMVVSSLVHSYGKANEIETYFDGISNAESSANIRIDSVLAERRRFDDYGNMIVSVDVEAAVYRYKEAKDPAFYFDLTGLKDVYYVDEPITFSFEPSRQGHLTIFAFNEQEAFVLYPYKHEKYAYLSDEPNFLFEAGKRVEFPMHEAYLPGYSIELKEGLSEESCLLVFVYTKERFPWLDQQLTLSSMRAWLYEIPMHKRDVVYRNLVLKQLN